MFYETESYKVLPDALVFLTEEGGWRNSLQLPILAQPLGKPVVPGGVCLRAEVDLVSEAAPVSHHEVSSLRYDGLHPHLRQDLGQEIPLPLQVNRDRLEVAVVLAQPAHLLLEAPGDRLLDGSGASVLEISHQSHVQMSGL